MFVWQKRSCKLTWPWIISHFDGIYQKRWWFSWAMLVSGRVTSCEWNTGSCISTSLGWTYTLIQKRLSNRQRHHHHHHHHHHNHHHAYLIYSPVCRFFGGHCASSSETVLLNCHTQMDPCNSINYGIHTHIYTLIDLLCFSMCFHGRTTEQTCFIS